MLTFGDMQDFAKHAVGGMIATRAGGSIDLCNRAGARFFSMERWSFRQRTPASLAFVAGQDFINMPADFGDVIGAYMSDGVNDGISFVDAMDHMRRRASTITSANHWWATVVRPPTPNRRVALKPPRIDLWPTPQEDNADAVKVSYLSLWPTMVNDTDIVPIPDELEDVMLELVSVFAKGWHHEAKGTIAQRYQQFRKSDFFIDSVETDGLHQPAYGEIRGGAVESQAPYSRLYWDTVPNPNGS